MTEYWMDQLGYLTEREGEAMQWPAVETVYHLRSYGDVSKAALDYYAIHRTLDGFAETQRSNSGEPAK